MPTFSLCMIVKNEAAVLGRCLDSAGTALFDEIIIADTGSDDQTKAVAAAYTNKIYDFIWKDDFAEARNFAFSKATCDYIMWLDADDVIAPKDLEQLLDFKASMPPENDPHAPDVVMMKYDTAFDENDHVTFTYYRERLIRRRGHFLWEGAVHEVITPRGRIAFLPAAVQHRKIISGNTMRNLRIYESMQKNGGILSPRHQFYYARELYSHQFYARALRQFKYFLTLKDGWSENKIDACRLASDCCLHLSQKEEALTLLFQAMRYGVPGAELCCDLGRWFYSENLLHQAVYWYEQALACPRSDTVGKFISEDCYGYIPYMWLCVCYDALGDHQKAFSCNEAAGKIKPYSAAYLWNKKYFDSVF